MHEKYGLKSNSAEMQDIAAALLLGKDKIFLDIGASSAVLGNNTFLLEKELGWGGLCFDLREEGTGVTATTFTNKGGTYEERGVELHNVDCTTPAFLNILKENSFPQIVDYVSMDVDAASIPTLLNLVETGGYIFKFLTYEHDYHYSRNHNLSLRHRDVIPQGTLNKETEVYESGVDHLWTQPFSQEGIDARKYRAKDMLQAKGYLLLFEDVCFETGGGLHPMEDWWINPQYFPEWIKGLQGVGLHFSECIKRISQAFLLLHDEEAAKLIKKSCFI
tara:strand:- start:1634 stop:2461 length:828 start_codon:yes stop_codon:yes gene_type:complete